VCLFILFRASCTVMSLLFIPSLFLFFLAVFCYITKELKKYSRLDGINRSSNLWGGRGVAYGQRMRLQSGFWSILLSIASLFPKLFLRFQNQNRVWLYALHLIPGVHMPYPLQEYWLLTPKPPTRVIFLSCPKCPNTPKTLPLASFQNNSLIPHVWVITYVRPARILPYIHGSCQQLGSPYPTPTFQH
jgi:hypothetical protein